MGATAATPANLVIGAGDLTADSTDVGVTADDNTFTIEEEIFEPDNLNGVPGMLVGTQYKIRGEGMLACSMPEIDATRIGYLWPGSQSTGSSPVQLDWDGTRRIPTSAFKDYVLTVPGLDGKSFTFEVDDAINQGSLEFAGQNAGLMAPRGEFHSKWDPTALTASPYRITYTPAGS
jgi:hypothetical protein